MKQIRSLKGIVFKIMALTALTISFTIIITLYFGAKSSSETAAYNRFLYSNHTNNILERTKEESVQRKFVLYGFSRSMMIQILSNHQKNAKKTELLKNILPIIISMEGIISYQAFDDNDKIIISAYKKDGGIIYSDNIPPHITKNATIEKKSYPDDGLTIITNINLDSFIQRIEDGYETYYESFDFLIEDVENNQKRMMQENIIKFFLAIIVSLYILSLIIKKLIKIPINKISNQINSFFIKLKNNETEIKNLNLNTDNELGLIADFLDSHLKDMLVSNYKMKTETDDTNTNIRSSKLIQQSLITENKIFDKYFKNYFIYFRSKNIIGGDIYFLNEINESKIVLMCIDCTGHNISGAFVSMSVSIIQNRIIRELKTNKLDFSPSKILQYFNREMKLLFDDKNLIVGFDGGIICFDTKEIEITYSGANIPLYYSDDKKTIKSLPFDKYSVGYKSCIINREYSEHKLKTTPSTRLFITTDGFIDQIGENGFRFGKKRFIDLIERSLDNPLRQNIKTCHKELMSYQGDEIQTDDITFIALSCEPFGGKDIEETDTDNIFIAGYEGKFSNKEVIDLVSDVDKKLTLDKASMTVTKKVITTIIETSQNISKYSKNTFTNAHIPHPDNISIKRSDESYIITALNVINLEDKLIISNTLDKIQGMDKKEKRATFRELRKSGQGTHTLGAGIGLYQIATKSDSIDYYFSEIKNDFLEMDSEVDLVLRLTVNIK